jgi:hypothetical protein
MPGEAKQLCDACQERPAVYHVHTFFGGEAEQKRALCEQCFQRSAAEKDLASLRRLQQAIRNGKCRYCGAPAVGGSSRKNLWCRQCAEDLAEFANRPENKLSGDWESDDDSAMAEMSRRLAERRHRQEEYMRERISDRAKQKPGH